jgi:hypothetical protein
VLSAVKLSATRFHAAGSGATIATTRRDHTPTGATITYTDSVAAKTTFTIVRVTTGRRSGSRCVAASKAKRGARPCTLTATAGTATHADVAGTNRVRFTARVKGGKLPTGSYRLELVARASDGAHSATRTVSFTIVS